MLLYYSAIIIVHELGHITAALYYKWNIEKVILLPFGGLTIFNEKINRPIAEEFIILIMGPIFQILGTIIYVLLTNDAALVYYSKIILFFNLIPIYPLDGSRLLNLIFNKLTSFRFSFLLTLYISILFIIIVLINNHFNLLLLFLMFFLAIRVLDEYKGRKFMFNLFLLERYFYNFNFKKEIIINKVSKMKRDCKHIFKKAGRYKTEKEILKSVFDRQHKL